MSLAGIKGSGGQGGKSPGWIRGKKIGGKEEMRVLKEFTCNFY